MTSPLERLCAECERWHPIKDVHRLGDGTYRCDECYERLELDHLICERQPRSDGNLTRPLGDPREAGHGGSTAA